LTYYSYYGMFSIMSKNIVVTNLRVEQNLWLQIKSMAAGIGLSTNEYIIQIVQEASARKELALDKKGVEIKTRSIWELPKLAKIKDKPMGLSQEDEIIYGI